MIPGARLGPENAVFTGERFHLRGLLGVLLHGGRIPVNAGNTRDDERGNGDASDNAFLLTADILAQEYVDQLSELQVGNSLI